MHQGPCRACRTGGHPGKLQPGCQHLHGSRRQHEPQHPEGAPCLHHGHGAGCEKRNHAVRHRDVHHHHEAPQRSEHADPGQRMRLPHHRERHTGCTQRAHHTGRGNGAGMQLVFRLAQAHTPPKLRSHPSQPCAGQQQSGQGQRRPQVRARQPQQPPTRLQKQHGAQGRHGQGVHPQPLGARREKKARKVQRDEAQHHHRGMHQRGRQSHALRIPQPPPAGGAVHLHRQPPRGRCHQHHHRQKETEPVRRQHQVLPAPALVELGQHLRRWLARSHLQRNGGAGVVHPQLPRWPHCVQ